MLISLRNILRFVVSVIIMLRFYTWKYPVEVFLKFIIEDVLHYCPQL